MSNIQGEREACRKENHYSKVGVSRLLRSAGVLAVSAPSHGLPLADPEPGQERFVAGGGGGVGGEQGVKCNVMLGRSG